MKTVTGNTYPVKDQLHALGGRWNPDKKGWDVPDDKYSEAVKIVGGGSSASKKPFFAKCHECGAPSRGYYRCYDCSLEYVTVGHGTWAGSHTVTAEAILFWVMMISHNKQVR